MTSLQAKASALRTEAIQDREQGDYQSSLKKLFMSLSFESSPLTYLEKAKTLLKIYRTENYAEAFGIIEDLSRVRELDKHGSYESEVTSLLDILKTSIEARCKEVAQEDVVSFLSMLNIKDESRYAMTKIPQDTLMTAIYDAKKTADLCKEKIGYPELEQGIRQLEVVLESLFTRLIHHERSGS